MTLAILDLVIGCIFQEVPAYDYFHLLPMLSNFLISTYKFSFL